MKDVEDELIGQTLRGKWKVDALLGTGGMAKVFAATHRNGMRGAIKILRPQLEDNDSLRERLVREGYVANHIQHPGVVRVLDDDVTDDGRAFIVMELLEGETWKGSWLRSGKTLPAQEVLRVAADVLSILEAAHRASVVHRDVKPDNVFLTKDGEVKLLDFGIARLREGTVDQTQTGAMLGTPAFMSPEQALARWSQVDLRSDLFSLAATIWVLLTGKFIHKCDTVPELLVATATTPPPSFSTVAPGAPTLLVEAIDKGLGFEPKARFQSAAEMRAALLRARASLPLDSLLLSTEIAGPSSSPSLVGEATEKVIARGGTEVMPPVPEKPAAPFQPSASPSVPSVLDATRTQEAIVTGDGALDLPASDPPLDAELPDRTAQGETASALVTGTSDPDPVARPRSLINVIALGAVAVIAAVGLTSTLSGSSLRQPALIVGRRWGATTVAPRATAIASFMQSKEPPATPPPPIDGSSAPPPVISAVPRRPHSSLPPFDHQKANQLVTERTEAAQGFCSYQPGPRVIPVTVSYYPDGRQDASVAASVLGTGTAICVVSMMSTAAMGPFEGAHPESVSTTVSLAAQH